MKMSGWGCLFLPKTFWKNGLEEANITLWASTCCPSSQTKVTSLKSLSSLKFPNALLILSWKSFHWRHSFSDILNSKICSQNKDCCWYLGHIPPQFWFLQKNIRCADSILVIEVRYLHCNRQCAEFGFIKQKLILLFLYLWWGLRWRGLLHLVFLVSNLPLSDPGLGDLENSPSPNQ